MKIKILAFLCVWGMQIYMLANVMLCLVFPERASWVWIGTSFVCLCSLFTERYKLLNRIDEMENGLRMIDQVISECLAEREKIYIKHTISDVFKRYGTDNTTH